MSEIKPEPFVMPSFLDGWNSLPVDVQGWVCWILGILVVFFFVAAIGYLFAKGGVTLLHRGRGDASGVSSGISDIFFGVVIIVVVLVALALVLSWIL